MSNKPDFIVGMGASAGGLESLQDFFAHMPEVKGLAFIIVQHLSPDFKSLMDQLLSRFTDMTVKPAEDNMEVERDTIYLIPPKHNLTIRQGVLYLSEQDRRYGLNLPIDIFFKSLARDCREKAIAIVFSGTGSDGTSGILEISECNGLVICQDLDSAKFDGMSKSAIATNVVNKVLNPKKMGEFIKFYVSNPIRPEPSVEHITIKHEDSSSYGKIFSLLFKHHKVDFDDYKEKTIIRRIDRRIKTLMLDSLEKYIHRLEIDEQEIHTLHNDLLICVTSFFRDPEAFEYIEEEIIPYLFKVNSDSREIRVWIPGCATGEEAYSIAILLKEHADKLKKAYDIKIFASDINAEVLGIANQGAYAESQLASVGAERVERFFKSRGERYVVSSEIRNMIVFAPQNILTDPPFTKVDLICCRNLLIYIKSQIQHKVIASFHFALKRSGILFLGPSEGLGDYESYFTTESSQFKVYQKIHDSNLPSSALGLTTLRQPRVPHIKPGLPVVKSHFTSNILDLIVRDYIHDCLILNADEDIIHIYGSAKKYLNFIDGHLTSNISKLINEDLRSLLTSALFRVENEKQTLRFNDIPVTLPHGKEMVNLVIKPLFDEDKKNVQYNIIQFSISENTVKDGPDQQYDMSTYSQHIYHDLELQLKITKQELNTALEEAETTNEELQSTNEELLASNEELQSTNEELHSVNEELYTVNSEYQKKIEELTQLEDDIDNLLQSANIGTIFLDKQFTIRKITPAISETFSILSHDVGRPFEAFVYKFQHPDLIEILAKVLVEGREKLLEPRLFDDRWLILKVMPYIIKRKVSGLVITFVDISAIKEMESKLELQDKKIQYREQELDDFAFFSAHDLKAILRSNRYHLDQLALKLPDDLKNSSELEKLDKDEKVLLRIADSLVRFSDLGKKDYKIKYNQVDSILAKIIEPYRSDTVDIMTDNRVGSILCDEDSFEFIMRELVENAIQFNTSKIKEISIGRIEDQHEDIIYVKDNGIGIRAEDYSRVFKMFKKLNRKDDFSRGQGTGLSFCKRHLDRHGGRIWIDSEQHVGSTFYISFPREH